MATPWSSRQTGADIRAALAAAEPTPFWLGDVAPREPASPLLGRTTADLLIIGGGFTGLWAALQAKADDPGRDVMLIDAASVGSSASGRNGGFIEQSLTHGIANGVSRFPNEIDQIERLAAESFEGLVSDIARHGIDCDLHLGGSINVALEPHEVSWIHEEARMLTRHGVEVDVFATPEEMQAEVASPLYLAGVWTKSGAGTVHPAKLAQGLLDAVIGLGVRIHENSKVTGIEETGDRLFVKTQGGEVDARRVVLATSAHPSPVREIKRYVAPVYDYVLVTEPLTDGQLKELGWARRQGISDSANRFHYYRLTPDNRILWGGFEAVYRFGGPVGPAQDQDVSVFELLARNFFINFPQLEGIRFTHRWGGAIDTCSRFSVFFGSKYSGRLSYAAGYTGLGVGATRFGARVALDLVDGRQTAATGLEMVRKKPVPFPPEPLRSAVIQLTRNRLAAADRNFGRRGAWLRALDALGLGFDS